MKHSQFYQKSKPSTRSAKSGFTIIELTLTMAFVAVLLITIAIVTTNIVTIYQKGLTLKAVNSVGRSLVDEFTTAISSAPTMDVANMCRNFVSDDTGREDCNKDDARNFFYQQYKGTASGIDLENQDNTQYGGVFCTGRYSYLWNTQYGIETGHTIKVNYLDKSDNNRDTGNAARLVRFEDSTYRLCAAAIDKSATNKYKSVFSSNPSNIVTLDIRNKADGLTKNPIPDPDDGMLSEFDLDLVLYELSIFKHSQDSITRRVFTAGTFILATETGNVDITRSGDYCNVTRAGDETSSSIFNLGSEFNYCAINKFNFAARTAGV